TRRQASERLIDDLPALLHLKHAHQVAIIDIAVGANGNIKIKLLITGVGEDLAYIPGHAAAAQDGAAGSIGDGLLLAQHSHTLRSFEPELIVGQQRVIFLKTL